MVRNIVKGVAAALYEAFGDEYPIYQNDVRQGLDEPSFLVLAVGPSVTRQPNGLVLLNVPVDISYFPEDYQDNEEMNHVGFLAMYSVELIQFSDEKKLRGIRRSMNVVDGVLHVSVTYEVLLKIAEDVDPMEILDLHIHLRDSTRKE